MFGLHCYHGLINPMKTQVTDISMFYPKEGAESVVATKGEQTVADQVKVIYPSGLFPVTPIQVNDDRCCICGLCPAATSFVLSRVPITTPRTFT
jgi:hypothetical protein